jgi:hypothetical protein
MPISQTSVPMLHYLISNSKLFVQWLKSNKNCPACYSKCISPISPSQSSSHVPIISNIRPTVSRAQLSPSSEDSPDRSRHSTPSLSVVPDRPSPPLHHHTQHLESSLQKVLPALSATKRIVSEEIGKLLMLIALILVVCVIASPS